MVCYFNDLLPHTKGITEGVGIKSNPLPCSYEHPKVTPLLVRASKGDTFGVGMGMGHLRYKSKICTSEASDLITSGERKKDVCFRTNLRFVSKVIQIYDF